MSKQLSGLELREAVATKVMGKPPFPKNGAEAEAAGWRKTDGYGVGIGSIALYDEPVVWLPSEQYDKWLSQHKFRVPAYESSIEAAWEVVEKMEHKFHWRLKTPFMKGANVSRYFAGLTARGCSGWNGRPDTEASGDTMPEAICRAALAALESETP